jgi:hypothetical protein
MGWRIGTNVRIRFKLQFNASPGFHSLYDWCYHTMLLFSGVTEDLEDETVMTMHGGNALYSVMKSSMSAIWSEDQDAQQDATHRIIKIAKPWAMRWWSESKLANGKPLVRLPKEKANLVEFEWNEDMQAKLKTLVAKYTSCGASGAWRVPRWKLACFSSVLEDNKDWNDVSGQWHNELPLHTWVDTPIFHG